MEVTTDIDAIRRLRWRTTNERWGLVPTMGYLHAGHLALVERAAAENDRVAVSIFVNPTQFAPTEDLSSYPRDLARDLALLSDAGVDIVFTPDDAVMYGSGYQTWVTVDEITARLEGAARPSHFRGVTTIVAKLFNIFQPTRAYFGQKDLQQTVVLQQMVRDLNFNLDLIVCPTVREPDGLALSSRNRYLSAAERTAATVLYRALTAAITLLDAGERDGTRVRRAMSAVVDAEPLATADYVSVADPGSLRELEIVTGGAALSLAVRLGRTRLIDNMIWQPT